MTNEVFDEAVIEASAECALPACLLSAALMGLLDRLISVAPWPQRLALRWLRGHLARWRAGRCSDSRGY